MADSAQEAVARFDTSDAAAKYARSLGGTATHRREERCVCRLLRHLPPGSHVLDLPCGAGRLLPLLLDMGFRVTAADTSPHMLEHARRAVESRPAGEPVEFAVADALATGFDDDAFDGILCNRLFHHFSEVETRRRGLSELRRIGTGPIVISFFCNLGWDAMVFHAKNAVARNQADDRIPIPYRAFRRDIEATGLRIVRTMPIRPGISSQWYVEIQRRD